MIYKVKSKKAFTLAELLIVIAIIAILVAIAIPTFSSAIEKAQRSVAMSETRTVAGAAQTIYLLDTADGKNYANTELPPADVIARILRDANVSGSITGLTADKNNTIVHLYYASSNGYTGIYCKYFGSCKEASHTALITVVAKPQNTIRSFYVYDETTKKYIKMDVDNSYTEIKPPANGSQKLAGQIIYYDGSYNVPGMVPGYYHLSNGSITKNSNMEAYLNYMYTQTTWLKRFDPDVPVSNYTYNGKDNAGIIGGGMYYIDLDWDDVDGPVLALYTGTYGQPANTKRDMSKEASNSKVMWIVV